MRSVTTADRISAQYDDDGQVFEAAGEHITDACLRHCPYPDRVADSTRYEFSDGSAIVVCLGAWDLGYPEPATCHCWQGAGHHCEGADDA